MVNKIPQEKQKLTPKQQDEQFAARLPSLLQYHQNMLSDDVRNRLLANAIKRALKPGMSVIDIGTGTGTWAILAAKLGASRVVAVEAEEALIPIIYELAVENGVADQIEIIHGRSDDIRLKGKFDIIVCELFDGDAFGEATVKSFIDLRSRLLADGGVLIPERLEMLAAPAYFRRSVPDEAAEIELKTSFFSELKLNYSQSIPFAEHEKINFLAEPQALIALDFNAINATHNIRDAVAGWQLRDLSRANCIVTFNRSTFANDVVMDGLDSRSWSASLYPFKRLEKGKGQLRFSLSIDPKAVNWSISTPDIAGSKVQTYSPVFAFTRLKMALKTTPHKRFRSPK